MNSQIQEVQQSSSTRNMKQTTPRNFLIKLLKSWSKPLISKTKKSFKVTGEERDQLIFNRGWKVKITANFSP
jgi:hypothetical protein